VVRNSRKPLTKIADIGSDLMKIVFKIKEDCARNPVVIAGCASYNAGDSVGPSVDGFETFGVSGVALITFILLAAKDFTTWVQPLVWILAMLISSSLDYFVNGTIAKVKHANSDKMKFETTLTSLIWLTSIQSTSKIFIRFLARRMEPRDHYHSTAANFGGIHVDVGQRREP
jgi:K(+)-stimulated pyrophosphate-energized sodium pump